MNTLRWNNRNTQNLTLAVMLVVFVCQFFPNCLAISIEYAGDTHPLGHEINHQHSDHSDHEKNGSHDDFLKQTDVNLSNDLHLADASHLQEVEHSQTLLSTPDQLFAHEQAEHGQHEHEHSTHAHSFCHPPVENEFVVDDFQAETIALAMAQYQPLSYAPPLRPPHHV